MSAAASRTTRNSLLSNSTGPCKAAGRVIDSTSGCAAKSAAHPQIVEVEKFLLPHFGTTVFKTNVCSWTNKRVTSNPILEGLLPSTARPSCSTEEATRFWKRPLNSRLRVGQLLEARVLLQGFKHWIQSKQCRSERRVCSQRRFVRDRKQ